MPRNNFMGLISELRYPTRWYSKLIALILALSFFTLLATATISGSLLYRIVSPPHSRSETLRKDFPGHPEEVTFSVPGVGPRHGWFFPGLRAAPTIILCHGYRSDRGELLTLVTALQDNQFNVFLSDFAGHGSSPGITSFGFRETKELRAAIAAVAQRDDVDRERFGLWGANLGGYAAVVAASADVRVRAIAVDSVYDRPAEMVSLEVSRSGLAALPLIGRWAEIGFRWLNRDFRREPPLSQRMAGLAAVPKLFIMASDEPELAQTTRELFLRAPELREQVLLPRGNYAGMLDDDKRAYETRITSFFLLRLPPKGQPRR